MNIHPALLGWALVVCVVVLVFSIGTLLDNIGVKNRDIETYLETPSDVHEYLKDCMAKHGIFTSKRLDDEIGGWMVKCEEKS